MKISPNDTCPCDSGKKYKKCCRRYHNGMKVTVPSDLVRARWSAYALNLPDFIMKTTHPDNPDYEANFDKWRVRVEAYSLRNTFISLEIVSAEDDKVSYRGEMLAFQTRPVTVTEEAVFAQKDGAWLYLDGEAKTAENEAD